MALPAVGRLEYGNLVLSGPAVQTVGYTVRPAMDTAGRGRKYNAYSIQLKLWIAGSGPTDPIVANARSQLTTPGLPFIYSEKGAGGLRIGTIGSSDVLWGPIPKEMGYKPLGGPYACVITWSVDVAVVECGDTALSTGAAFDGLELTWSAAYQTDRSGLTTRTLTCMAKAAGVRAGKNGRQLSRTADEYREMFTPPQIPGFRRTFGPWTIDEAKTTLRGTVIDAEFEGLNFPPEWIVDVKASHNVDSSAAGLQQWAATISAEYEIAKIAPAGTEFDALRHFLGVIVKDRVQTTASSIQTPASIVPLGLSFGDPTIYGKRMATFRFQYSFSQPLQNILLATGLWRPVPQSNWNKWSTTMAKGPAAPRGSAGITLNPGDDYIADGCGGKVPPVFNSAPKVPAPPVGPSSVALPPTGEGVLRGGGRLPPDVFPAPQPSTSWLAYQIWLWVEQDDGTAVARELPEDPMDAILRAANKGNPFFNLPPLPNFVPAPGLGAVLNGAGKIVAQRRVRPLVYVFLRGYALRYGFPIPVPELNSFDEVLPVPANRLDRGEGYATGMIYGGSDIPIFGATWNKRYLIRNPGDGFTPRLPVNPFLNGGK